MTLTMPHELLNTKLTVPRLPTSLVLRERLLARLDESIQHKLTLIAAPAGFGKTTLVSEWLIARAPLSAWVSLDEGDNDPIRFWRYVITACTLFDSSVGQEALDLLNSLHKSAIEAAITILLNDLMQLNRQGVLVLEDYHVIATPEIHSAFAFFLDHLPANMHLIMLTRTEPPLPLARLRASDGLREFHAADLRFTSSEIQTFLQQALQLPVSEVMISQLAARTEGWGAALRLIALSWQGIDQFLSNARGSHRAISDYLIAEVFRAQSAAIQDFLLKTAFLSRLSPELCDHVTGRSDSQLILEELEQVSLFLIPLDHTGQWYRYHALFGEAIHHTARRMLGEDRLYELYDRASQWFEAQELYNEAVELALAARSFARAEPLIELIVRRYLLCELHTMRRWLEHLPQERFLANPMLCFMYANAVLFSSNRYIPETHQQFAGALDAAQHIWEQENNLPMLGALYTFRAGSAWWQGQVRTAVALSKDALSLLAPDDADSRSVNYIYLAWDQVYQGHSHAARQMLIDAQAQCRLSKKAIYVLRAVTLVLGEVCRKSGYLSQAAQIFEQIIAEITDLLDSPEDRGMSLAGLGAIAYERNDLVTAETHASQALKIGQEISDTLLQAYALIVLAKVKAAQGDYSTAIALNNSYLTRVPAALWEPLHREILAEQAVYALAIGDLAAVQQWYTSYAQYPETVPPLQQEDEALIVARWWIAEGKYQEALALIAPWQSDSQTNGRLAAQIENDILQAQIFWKQNQPALAKVAIIQALTLAYSEGYIRIFAGALPLLQLIADEKLSPALNDYLHQLIETFTPSIVADALSQQEIRVLRLLAQGLSNPEIADELVVSVNTIKTQVKSIYRKLGVSSREAVHDTARRLRLL